MDKKKSIEEMANAMGIALFNTYNGGILSKREREAVAEELIDANYGNIKQALTEFVKRLKSGIAFNIEPSKGMGETERKGTITELEIDETLKEFLDE